MSVYGYPTNPIFSGTVVHFIGKSKGKVDTSEIFGLKKTFRLHPEK